MRYRNAQVYITYIMRTYIKCREDYYYSKRNLDSLLLSNKIELQLN